MNYEIGQVIHLTDEATCKVERLRVIWSLRRALTPKTIKESQSDEGYEELKRKARYAARHKQKDAA